MRHAKKICAITICFAVFAAILGAIRWYWGNAWQHATVSPEVTRITAPLRADGTVDYVAAINQHFSLGLTAENNAAIALYRLADLQEYGDFFAHDIAARLNAPDLELPNDARNGSRLQAFDSFLAAHKKREPDAGQDDPLDLLVAAPWSAKDHPDVAEWLDAQHAPMELAAAAAKLPRYFVPLRRREDSDSLISVQISPLSLVKNIARMFEARAMLEIQQGQPELAATDAMVAIRLGYLLAQGPSIIEHLAGLATVDEALHAEIAIVETCPLTVGQARDFSGALSSLPPLPDFAECLDVYERYEVLDQFVQMTRYGPDAGTTGPHAPAGSYSFGIVPLRFDPVMREANQWADRLVAAAEKRGFGDRESSLAEVATEMAKSIPGPVSGNTSNQQALRSLIGFLDFDFRDEFRHRDYAQQDLNLVLAALGAIDHFQSESPGDQQIASWLQGIPGDVFTGGPLKAQLTGSQWVLSCDSPAPLPVHGVAIGGIMVGGTTAKREFSVNVRLR